MNTENSFEKQLMPNIFRVRFTVAVRNNKAFITGEIIMCDCTDAILMRSKMMEESPHMLHSAAEQLSLLQPTESEFFQALEMVMDDMRNIA